MIRSLYDLGLFSKEKRKIGKVEIAPRDTDVRPDGREVQRQ